MASYVLQDGTTIDVLDETLEQTIADDEEGRLDYETTIDLVRAALFSVFPDRKRYAKRLLYENWGAPDLVLKSVEEEGMIYGFLSFVGENGPYFFVERYNANNPIEERPTTPQEMKDWDNL